MKTKSVSASLFLLTIWMFFSCSKTANSLTPTQNSAVKNEVKQLMESVANRVSEKGPVAWLFYFENSRDFYMASDGKLVFPNKDTAINFINHTLVHSIRKIELHWSNIRIDPLTFELADIGANFHEDITNTNGNKLPVKGYFTGIAHQTSQGWKLHNAHWSILKNETGN